MNLRSTHSNLGMQISEVSTWFRFRYSVAQNALSISFKLLSLPTGQKTMMHCGLKWTIFHLIIGLRL